MCCFYHCYIVTVLPVAVTIDPVVDAILPVAVPIPPVVDGAPPVAGVLNPVAVNACNCCCYRWQTIN